MTSFRYNSEDRRKTRKQDSVNITHGFTIVETLVAIAVLMIAIAGPLVVATKGLTSALYAKDQMTAIFLAQESMEAIKNIRDNNIATGKVGDDEWLEVGSPPNTKNMTDCVESSPCDLRVAGGLSIAYPCIDGCELSFEDGEGYTIGAGADSKFKRHFFFEDLNGPDIIDTELRLHVVVDWNEGTVPYQVDLTSQIVKFER